MSMLPSAPAPQPSSPRANGSGDVVPALAEQRVLSQRVSPASACAAQAPPLPAEAPPLRVVVASAVRLAAAGPDSGASGCAGSQTSPASSEQHNADVGKDGGFLRKAKGKIARLFSGRNQ